MQRPERISLAMADDEDASRQRMRVGPIAHDRCGRDKPPNYRPASLNPLFLMSLGVYLCALIAILEFGIHNLPQSKVDSTVPNGEPIPAFVSGPLITARSQQTANASHRSLQTTHPLPTRDLTVRNAAHRRQIAPPPPWTLGNETNAGTTPVTAGPTMPIASGSALPGTPQSNPTSTVFFAGRAGILWPGVLNGTLLEGRKAARELDPGQYGLPESSLRALFFDCDRYDAELLVSFIAYNDYSVYLEDPHEFSPVACDGPALIFLDMDGWDKWQDKADFEAEVRQTGVVRVSVLSGSAPECSNWAPANPNIEPTTLLSTSTAVVEVIVNTDLSGEPVFTRTLYLSDSVAQSSIQTLRDQNGHPTGTVVEAVTTDTTPTVVSIVTLMDPQRTPTATLELELDSNGVPTATHELQLVTLRNSQGVPTATVALATLRNSGGTPTAIEEIKIGPDGIPTTTDKLQLVTLRNSQGIPTATVELTTWRDVHGIPTGIEEIQIGLDGIPITTNNLDLITLKDISGIPTATVGVELTTLRNAQGIPTATFELELITLRDANGQPTKTISSLLGRVTDPYGRVVLTDSNGLTIGTLGTNSDAVTLTDSNGVPTATVTGAYIYTTTVVEVLTPQPSPTSAVCPGENGTCGVIQVAPFHPITLAEYVAGYFVPNLLSLVVSIIAQIINSDIKVLLPFQALTRPGGAAAADSLAMRAGGIGGLVHSWTLLWRFHEPISLLGDLLLATSSVAVAFSSESFGVKLYGSCVPTDFHGCFMGLAQYTGPSRAIQGLLALMLAIVALLCFFLRKWTSGVAAPPTSIAVLSSLLQDETSKAIFQKLEIGLNNNSDLSQRKQKTYAVGCGLEEYNFSLGYFQSLQGEPRYGIITQRVPKQETATKDPPKSKIARASEFLSQKLMPRIPGSYKSSCSKAFSPVLNLGTRPVFLFILTGFAALIIYYKSTRLDTPFERFMDSQDFGVRILFTSIGLVISLFWEHEFSREYSSSRIS